IGHKRVSALANEHEPPPQSASLSPAQAESHYGSAHMLDTAASSATLRYTKRRWRDEIRSRSLSASSRPNAEIRKPLPEPAPPRSRSAPHGRIPRALPTRPRSTTRSRAAAYMSGHGEQSSCKSDRAADTRSGDPS